MLAIIKMSKTTPPALLTGTDNRKGNMREFSSGFVNFDCCTRMKFL